MNNRLKEIRKSHPKGKTQELFADFLGISPSNLASYETGRRTLTNAVIQLICQKCNVNEEWLRNGVGDMFLEISKDDEISKFFGDILKDDETKFKRRLIKALAQLNDENWDFLEDIIDDISKKE